MKCLQWANRKGRRLCRNRRVMHSRGSMELRTLQPAPSCCQSSEEAEDLTTEEEVVEEMDGRRPG